MATVVVPALLRKYTDGVERIEAQGASVRELIRNLAARYPELVEHLLQDGDLRPSIAVSVDGEVSAAGMLESVQANSEVHFIPALGGGR